MPKAQNTGAAAPAGAKRKLTRAEKKEIAAIIQRAKGDGKPHTAQQTIPYLQMYPDGIILGTPGSGKSFAAKREMARGVSA